MSMITKETIFFISDKFPDLYVMHFIYLNTDKYPDYLDIEEGMARLDHITNMGTAVYRVID